MRKTLALLAATTALTGAIGLPSWTAARALPFTEASPQTAIDQSAQMPFVLASNDEGDDEDDDHDEGDDDEGDDDEGEEDDDDDDCDGNTGCNGATSPAPSGSVPPPKNGLFGNGAPPKVQVN